MDIQAKTTTDRSEAIKTLIERWIEKNKAKAPAKVFAANAKVVASSTDETTAETMNRNSAKEAS